MQTLFMNFINKLKLHYLLESWQTTTIGVVIIIFTTWVFLDDKISWEQAIVGWNTGFGFILTKDVINKYKKEGE